MKTTFLPRVYKQLKTTSIASLNTIKWSIKIRCGNIWSYACSDIQALYDPGIAIKIANCQQFPVTSIYKKSTMHLQKLMSYLSSQGTFPAENRGECSEKLEKKGQNNNRGTWSFAFF